MTMKRLNVLFVVLTWVVASMAVPQLKIPQMISFESDEDLTDWILNPGTPNAGDQWIIGGSTHSEGKRSLYISCPPDTTPKFGNKPCVTLAYRKIKFPQDTIQKEYDLSFDYRCVGDTTGAMLYVRVCREAELKEILNCASETSGYIKPAITKLCEHITVGTKDTIYLNCQPEWTNATLTNDVRVSSFNSKKDYYLVFIWSNSVIDSVKTGGGICIDNIQFANARVRKPTNVEITAQCEDSTMLITWESALTTFTVEYSKLGSQTWRRIDNITEGTDGFEMIGTKQSFRITQLPEATYNVRVMGILNADTSAYAVVNRWLLYCPDNHCINYMNLHGKNVVCYYGFEEKKGTPQDNIGVVDYGPDVAESRHTIHTDPTETDDRTDNQLFTVPDGALGSVRLGNWLTGNEAECIEYSYVVDSATQGILLIKYAVVLNKPNDGCGDPGFKLVVLDAKGREVDDICGKADFSYSSAKAAGWNETQDGSVVWKNWTTVGLNLQQYNGQKLTVQLTTRDCGGGGHFGYAYFTMDCANANIETENCGDDMEINAEAPPGFRYTWMDETGKIVGDKQTLTVPPGHHEYTCRVSYIEEDSCYFDLKTLAAPRYPVAEYSTSWIPRNCRNYMKFINSSHVLTMYQGKELHTAESCDDYEWTFKSLKTGAVTQQFNPSPTYTCLAEGDSVVVTLTAYLGEEHACEETKVDTIYIPSIIPNEPVFRKEFCEGNAQQFAGEWYTESGVYTDMKDNFAGCDSLSTLILTVHPNSPELYLADTVCSSRPRTFNGLKCDTAGHYEAWLRNSWGCDSIVHLKLIIKDDLNLDIDKSSTICADGSMMFIHFAALKGEFDSISMHFSKDAIAAGFHDSLIVVDQNAVSITYPYPADVLPGKYYVELEYFQHKSCGSHVYRHDFEVRYSSSIIQQKWNDVLAVLNSKYNGGYEFNSFQWYKNGLPIEGATGPYFYETLNSSDEYYVEMIRSDGVVVSTCAVRPSQHNDIFNFPTLAKVRQRLAANLNQSAVVMLYSMAGQIYSSTHVVAGESMVDMPSQPGIYLISFLFDDGRQVSQTIVIVE